MINALIQGIINFLSHLITLILTPLDLLIRGLLPDLSGALTLVDNFITHIINYVPLAISYTGLTNNTLSIIISLITAIVVIPLTAHGVKLALQWYNALKL